MPGTDVTITTLIEYSGSLSAVGVEVALPTDWSFASANGVDAPGILPSPKDTGILNFGWITPPVSPIDFTYTVKVPADTVGSQQITSRVKYRRLAGELIEPVDPDSLIIKKCKGDFDEDYDVDGEDLTDFSDDENVDTLKSFAEEFGRTDCD